MSSGIEWRTRAPAGVERLDAHALARDLRRATGGEVRFSDGARALYANDASVYRQVPVGVVVPRTLDDVVATVETCRAHGAPILARGCATGLAGQSVNTAVVLDFSKYLHALEELDPDRRVARVQPGIVLDRLRERAEEHDLTFGPDPATHSRCTLGGMIGNNSCGVHSIMSGVTADNVEALDVLLYDGTRLRVSRGERALEGPRAEELTRRLVDLADRYADRIRAGFPQIPRRISGYNLDRLLPENGFDVAAALTGTEGTCALVLRAECKLVESPQHRALVLVGYDDTPTAADQVTEIMELGPIGLETFDRKLVDNELRKGFARRTDLLPAGDAWLLVEFGASSREEVDEQAERLLAALRKQNGPHVDAKLFEDAEEERQVWEIREGGVGHSKLPGEHPGWPSWEDAAVPPERTGEYLRDFEALVARHGLHVAAYFGHIGHGCLHTRLDFDFSTVDGVRRYRRFLEDAADLVSAYGGSLSGEHGDGQARAELLPRMFGAELVEAFSEFKAIWDPDNRLNPGKLAHPWPLDTNLRFTPAYRTRPVKTHFRYPEDGGSFAAATERCFGVGACRDQSGTMCPSYQVTLEESALTRGRARLLWEMMHASQIRGGWRDRAVKESLDLCLACKGCKHECPVRVDIATYKAEFLSHWYAGRPRPPHAYLLGLVHWEARLAARAPRLANALAASERAAPLKRALGIAPERRPPAFADRTFKQWFAARPPRNEGRPPVLLWPDTFTNHFHPEVGIAAVEVLEAAGFDVRVPAQPLCCGRPLYDYGMLTLAKRQLRRILGALREDVRAGVPLVALEPSCGAVFRDELVNLYPDDEDARRLRAQTHSLAEFLERHAAGWAPPRLEGRALVHFHCHQKATSDVRCDRAVLDRLGLDYEVLDSGCCGLAGSFGYEAGERYDVSVAAGERVLLPAVRDAENALVLSDGFSCRSQIEHGTGRRALHLAQAIRLGLGDGPAPPAARGENGRRGRIAVAAAGAGLLGAAGIVAASRRR